MKKILFLVMPLLLVVLFSGCVANTLEITKCKTYKNGICTVKKVESVKLCKEPTIVDGKTYCHK